MRDRSKRQTMSELLLRYPDRTDLFQRKTPLCTIDPTTVGATQ